RLVRGAVGPAGVEGLWRKYGLARVVGDRVCAAARGAGGAGRAPPPPQRPTHARALRLRDETAPTASRGRRLDARVRPRTAPRGRRVRRRGRALLARDARRRLALPGAGVGAGARPAPRGRPAGRRGAPPSVRGRRAAPPRG